MSFFRKETPPQPPPDLSASLEPEKTSETKPELDPVSEELHNRAVRERLDITRKIFDLESTERTLLSIGMQKDSGITPDSKFPEILDYVNHELKRNRELKDEL
ncbi:MAG: hypothetical protein A3B91_01510 [Candidatus Yanofskybacteria bacterium RIFCSPHIGHO2_02_FULL_41_29]|uniref:Uncharacterized protein n=1 Tax=Candidatus Yanofskybacteria bacterium RIFCSPHIGHO2_01_FULL_41_53 TaxID=1802663 RepID=A0A1F8EH55_9BACT|nr:MAG: hypothetical protein A2650_00930 [Candidatus Yanofskybacteria bacterium RIFCSPHIGHO2_01_FULL_41_53]OGN11047.1 MAG: hypothetical protein A3B91_01510 [Candidatus Yanofskybacteria bacterium RIFCSPHIGHO2_02_FULL_41_29]OGN18480.1 MAG: hypothetical protein A3F48_02685 [Candidatus Yanofskybacteria bacterium RIFCSPHIGHO2_12_FULL_41_9]OGN21964.1 MAG: hypothetical protein A2916_02955 [Candidatus Yanofskybacteria bacterium RIFCSPLOWO2_01_FULL_41_67]OGN30239.1 MAG: hypothetical protein A3H54_02635 